MHIQTMLLTWIYGKRIGTDAQGNRYYSSKRLARYGRERRWVVFKGKPEATRVPPEWYAWLHHTSEQPLTESAAAKRPWQSERMPNLSGTSQAYRPEGHDLRGGKRAKATGDYEPWKPE